MRLCDLQRQAKALDAERGRYTSVPSNARKVFNPEFHYPDGSLVEGIAVLDGNGIYDGNEHPGITRVETVYQIWHQIIRKARAGAPIYPYWRIYSQFHLWYVANHKPGLQVCRELGGWFNQEFGPETTGLLNSKMSGFLQLRAIQSNLYVMYRGVVPNNKGYSAGVYHKNRRTLIGWFTNPLDAHLHWLELKHKAGVELLEAERQYLSENTVKLFEERLQDLLNCVTTKTPLKEGVCE